MAEGECIRFRILRKYAAAAIRVTIDGLVTSLFCSCLLLFMSLLRTSSTAHGCCSSAKVSSPYSSTSLPSPSPQLIGIVLSFVAVLILGFSGGVDSFGADSPSGGEVR